MPSNNLLFLWLWGNYSVMYDETYAVIYEVIARKFRVFMEPFWDLKIGIYVEYLTHVSSEYITSWVLLSLISTADRTSRVLLADVIPWINKASLVLYIARTLCAMPRPTWCSEAVWRCRVRLLWLKIVSVEVESRSQTPSLWLRRQYQCVYALYWRPFTIWTIMHAATGQVVKCSYN